MSSTYLHFFWPLNWFTSFPECSPFRTLVWLSLIWLLGRLWIQKDTYSWKFSFAPGFVVRLLIFTLSENNNLETDHQTTVFLFVWILCFISFSSGVDVEYTTISSWCRQRYFYDDTALCLIVPIDFRLSYVTYKTSWRVQWLLNVFTLAISPPFIVLL